MGLALCAAPPAFAQSDGEVGFEVTARAQVPASPDATRYVTTVKRHQVETEMTYAISIEGDITSGARREPRASRSVQWNGGGAGREIGVFMVLLVLAVALFVWMRFGGAGVLLSRPPAEMEDKERTVAPDSWRIDADAARNPQGLLARLAALPDRREAMIQLLRHCLLRAGDESDTRFARADTEREAFARLPSGWSHHSALNQLLRDTELVHYGGRDVTEDAFARAFELGGAILGRGRHA